MPVSRKACMAGPRAKTKARDRVSGEPRLLAREEVAFIAAVGRLVRLGRAKRGMTRRQLAAESGASERYLAHIESGRGNPSIIILKAIAAALEVPIIELLPPTNAASAALTQILDLLGRMPVSDLPAIAEMLEARSTAEVHADRARRIALVGLRGAGKSTLGRLLAAQLQVPFIELDRAIEHDYGANVPFLIEMSGLATFRRYERTCLERVVAENEAAVITTAGGIVSNPDTYSFLLRRTHTVWIKARPDEHMTRVMQQGDFRPMAKNREAMADLVAILEARRADYARAQAELDTSDDAVEQSLAKLVRLVGPYMRAPGNERSPAARSVDS